MINIVMIIALEKAHQFLIARQELKKACAIRDLINLIYTDTDKSFSRQVADWELNPNSEYPDETNQDIITSRHVFISSLTKAASAPVIYLSGFFSESIVKYVEDKTKTDTEILIEKLVAHSQLWSGNLNEFKNAASSIPLKNSSHSL